MKEIRKEIDKIDEQICVLYERRMHLAQEIAAYKKEKNLPVFDEEREAFVLKKGIDHLDDSELREDYRIFLQCLMAQSKSVQEKWLAENR